MGSLRQVSFMALRLFQGTESLVYLVGTDRGADSQPVGGSALAAGGLLGLKEVSEKNVTVCQCFLHDEGI